MPELPEVETIRRDVLPFVKGKTFTGLKVLDHRNIKGISPQQLGKNLRGKKILGIERRAKYLIFPLSPKGYLVVHLGMTGRLLFAPDGYVKLVFLLSGDKKLYFSDARLFGKVRYYDNYPDMKLGPEPFSGEFTVEKFKAALRKRNVAIKNLLLDQKFLAGVGNIYDVEALFRAGIQPERKANRLKDAEMKKLHAKIKEVLKEGVKHRGTSDSWYVDAKGEKGSFQLRLKVYGRKGKPCFKCKSPIKRIVMGQRGTYFCPKCQK